MLIGAYFIFVIVAWCGQNVSDSLKSNQLDNTHHIDTYLQLNHVKVVLF